MRETSKLRDHVTKTRISDWDGLVNEYRELTRKHQGPGVDVEWLFRGQQDSTWGLQTSFERVMDRFEVHPLTRPEREKGLIRYFMRQSHHYTPVAPHPDCALEWLALMQHYGAPTRLLDWTYSFFVAAYFAVEKAEGESAIWVLDRKVLDREITKRLPSCINHRCITKTGLVDSGDCFDNVFDRVPPLQLVYPVNPYRLNERLIIQQGIFLCPGDVSLPFQENLVAVLKDAPRRSLRKLIISGKVEVRTEILRHLQRMNMNAATLFPGLEGFARSLNTRAPFPEMIVPGEGSRWGDYTS